MFKDDGGKASRRPTLDPTAPIVVLGSRTTAGRPELLLRARLATAARLSQAHPDAPIVVSGHGEALPMHNYLTAQGINPERILLEPLATSTNENLENSARLLSPGSTMTVVTSNFHILRTRLWAWHLKIPIHTVAAPTPHGHKLHNYARELAATPHSALRIAWRRLRHRLEGRPD
ncbi:YdcF family protein [Corynebacterium sp. HMSC04H06]|uniref:YdcF family protein n=1 Tax=Corynebacterium sp. HMSC04H06 TaxID=1581050 RepID=UPI0008A3E28B|nr:YdcF family protein [Corynebacterium sp. HMSC04H06]OFS20254.1 hypothetical protein HMPREF3067_08415 [Corynebacterium sp. HMSC04H06]